MKNLRPSRRLLELEQENERLNLLLKQVAYVSSLERFACLKGLTDDSCPCWGGPIRVNVNDHGHMVLEATRL